MRLLIAIDSLRPSFNWLSNVALPIFLALVTSGLGYTIAVRTLHKQNDLAMSVRGVHVANTIHGAMHDAFMSLVTLKEGYCRGLAQSNDPLSRCFAVTDYRSPLVKLHLQELVSELALFPAVDKSSTPSRTSWDVYRIRMAAENYNFFISQWKVRTELYLEIRKIFLAAEPNKYQLSLEKVRELITHDELRQFLIATEVLVNLLDGLLLEIFDFMDCYTAGLEGHLAKTSLRGQAKLLRNPFPRKECQGILKRVPPPDFDRFAELTGESKADLEQQLITPYDQMYPRN